VTTDNGLERICITGGIACGKSLVGKVLTDLGVAVRDTDDICHELMKSGGDIFTRIVSAFGSHIVDNSGEINRRVLARLVFSDSEKRNELNRLVHPDVSRALNEWIGRCAARRLSHAKQKEAGIHWTHGVAAIIPLAYEVGWVDSWNWVICVGAPVTIQIARLKHRGVSGQEALDMIAAQFPVEKKMRMADYVIFNAGTMESTKNQTLKVFQDITNQVERKHGRKE